MNLRIVCLALLTGFAMAQSDPVVGYTVKLKTDPQFSEEQKACAPNLGTHCKNIACRVDFSAKMVADSDITYHNDGPSERSNSVQLLLSTILRAFPAFPKPNPCQDKEDPRPLSENTWTFQDVKYQHTHGTHSALYVLQRPCNCLPGGIDVKGYDLMPKDRIYVYFGSFQRGPHRTCIPARQISTARRISESPRWRPVVWTHPIAHMKITTMTRRCIGRSRRRRHFSQCRPDT